MQSALGCRESAADVSTHVQIDEQGHAANPWRWSTLGADGWWEILAKSRMFLTSAMFRTNLDRFNCGGWMALRPAIVNPKVYR
jgi:hypothetical protein